MAAKTLSYEYGEEGHLEACRIHSRIRLWTRYGIDGVPAQNAVYDQHTRLILGTATQGKCRLFTYLHDACEVYEIENLVKGNMYPVWDPKVGVIKSYLSEKQARRSRRTKYSPSLGSK